MNAEFWNARYSDNEYAYGKEPNQFFAEEIKKLTPGIALFPCDGEGRNSVYAATLGWKVSAFDFSASGKEKADKLASENNVEITFQTADASAVEYEAEQFDLIVFTFAHLPENIRMRLHKEAINWLKPEGKIIYEAYNPKQLNNNTGGPKDLSMLGSREQIAKDFGSLTTQYLEELQVEVNEGKFHNGVADVIRFVGRK
jgi:ubiquinone/menaquinone biosynthesis C-methylase UbiE